MAWFRRDSTDIVRSEAIKGAERLLRYAASEAEQILIKARATGDVASDAESETLVTLCSVLAHLRDRVTAEGFKELGPTHQKLFMSHFCLAIASGLTGRLYPRLGEPLALLRKAEALRRIEQMGLHLGAIDRAEVLSKELVLEGAYCVTMSILGSAKTDQRRKAEVLRLCASSIAGVGPVKAES